MRLSHTNIVPLLPIVAGGVIGASLSFSFLESRFADVPLVVLDVPLLVHQCATCSRGGLDRSSTTLGAV